MSPYPSELMMYFTTILDCNVNNKPSKVVIFTNKSKSVSFKLTQGIIIILFLIKNAFPAQYLSKFISDTERATKYLSKNSLVSEMMLSVKTRTKILASPYMLILRQPFLALFIRFHFC